MLYVLLRCDGISHEWQRNKKHLFFVAPRLPFVILCFTIFSFVQVFVFGIQLNKIKKLVLLFNQIKIKLLRQCSVYFNGIIMGN
jgi:hypothetical protein